MNRFLLNTVLVAVVMAPQSLSVANAQSKDDKSELEFSIGAATVVGGTGLGIDSIRTTRNGKQVITSASFAGNKDGARAEIRIWDTAKKSETGVITTDIEQIVTLAIDPAGKRLTAITGEDEVVSWTINDGRLLFRTAASEYPRGGLLYSPDGNVLLVGGVDVSALNPMTGQLLAETEMQNDQFAADIAAAGNGEFLALATDEGVVISDSRTMQTQLFLATEEVSNLLVVIARDSRTVIAGGDDGSIRVWKLPQQEPIHILRGHSEPVSGIAFVDSDRRLVSCSMDGTLRLWNLKDGVEEQSVTVDSGTIEAMCVTPDGKTLISNDHNKLEFRPLESNSRRRRR